MNRFFISKTVFCALGLGWLASTLCLAENLVRNGAFTEPGAVTSPQPAITRPDNRIPSWVLRGEWYIDQKASSPLPGSQVIRVGGGSEHEQLFQYVYLQPGKEYTLSAWMRGRDLIKLDSTQQDNQTGVLVTNFRWSERVIIGPSSEKNGEWERYHLTFKAPEAYQVGGVVQPCMVRIFVPKDEVGTMWVTGIQLEEGSRLTDFQPISRPQQQALHERLVKTADTLEKAAKRLKDFEGGSKEALLLRMNELKKAATTLEERTQATNPSVAFWEKLEKEAEAFIASAGQYTRPFGWWANAWNELPLRALPKEPGAIEKREIRMTVGVNDYGAVMLPLVNLTETSIPMEVKVGEEVAPLSVLSSFRGPIQVSTAFWVSNEGYVTSLSPVKEHQAFPYFLQPLGNSNTTLLPVGETTQLWFDINTRNMAPGEYRYPVKLIGLNGDYSWEGSILLEVLPVQLPEKVPTNVVAYTNMPFFMEPFNPHGAEKSILKLTAAERAEIARPWLEIWEEMGFNRFMLTNQYLDVKFNKDGSLAHPIDYSIFDAYHELWSAIGSDYWSGWSLAAYHIYRDWRDLSKIKIDSHSRKRTKAVLTSFLDHAKKKGLTPETMPISLFDEPHGKRIDVTRVGVEALRSINPQWKVMAAVAGTQVRNVEPLLPLLDLFVVRQRMGQMDMTPETIDYLREQGKEVWGYSCSGSLEYLHPYRYYRLLPWQAWSNKLTGYALYMTIAHKEYPNIGARSSFFSPLFLGRDGPVIGKGARGFQLGGRDWSLMSLAKELLTEAKRREVDASVLETLLKEAPPHVLEHENDAEIADGMRVEMLREVARLQANLPAPEKNSTASTND